MGEFGRERNITKGPYGVNKERRGVWKRSTTLHSKHFCVLEVGFDLSINKRIERNFVYNTGEKRIPE